jgi:hypothetical protein
MMGLQNQQIISRQSAANTQPGAAMIADKTFAVQSTVTPKKTQLKHHQYPVTTKFNSDHISCAFSPGNEYGP